MNPDYWNRPIRDARSSQDYGHTQLAVDSRRGTIRGALLCAAFVVAVVFAGVAVGWL